MFNTNLVFSVKISKEFTSSNKCFTGSPGKNQGFTLMELMVSMTIISMVVVVLYFAFFNQRSDVRDVRSMSEKSLKTEEKSDVFHRKGAKDAKKKYNISIAGFTAIEKASSLRQRHYGRRP
jgi:prepilin-type N-terminal cleavage/methylation domain-containing protein